MRQMPARGERVNSVSDTVRRAGGDALHLKHGGVRACYLVAARARDRSSMARIAPSYSNIDSRNLDYLAEASCGAKRPQIYKVRNAIRRVEGPETLDLVWVEFRADQRRRPCGY